MIILVESEQIIRSLWYIYDDYIGGIWTDYKQIIRSLWYIYNDYIGGIWTDYKIIMVYI